MEKLILGLDISTSCIGVSVASFDKELDKFEILLVDAVKFKKNKKNVGTDSLFFKADMFKSEFIDKYKGLGITDIVIEEPLISSTNALTCNTLTKFNGMISQLVYVSYGIIPQYISSYNARKFAFPDLMCVRKYNKKGEIRSKEEILSDINKNKLFLFGDYPLDCEKKKILHNKIRNIFPDIKWKYNKKGELTVENYDASDSLVCVLGYINMLIHPNVDIVITPNTNGEKFEISSQCITYCTEYGVMRLKKLMSFD